MERMQGHYENQAQNLKYQMKIRNIVMGKKTEPQVSYNCPIITS